jgi:DNA polymerase
LTYDEKRTVFKEMYAARCGGCVLAKTRKTFVFGAGNVDAPLMIIGEAPGAEEDEQGLPFVGAAGRLLTELLEAIAIDRKKDVFITNILKCRPPDNRTPDAAEVVACMPIVQKQIEIISPRLLLLLGRIAAHALLGTADGIGKLRGREHVYRGIPVIVTYHPAALLRTSEYRGPAGEDFRTVAGLLRGKR